jgi:hypothetical protein
MINIGNVVRKKSGKPFKNTQHTQCVVGFSVNPNDPMKRVCCIFDDESVCNVKMLELVG